MIFLNTTSKRSKTHKAIFMKYMGSKNRIAKHILPIMLKHREEEMAWVEPFVGGANMIDKVKGERIGADLNEYLIEALILIRDNPEKIPDLITEDEYQKLKQEMKVSGLTGFTGFAMSFGGKFFGGYRRDVAGTKGCIENMKTQTRRSKQNAIKQSKSLKGVKLVNCSYDKLPLNSDNCLIYCDPPYEGTTEYRDKFDHTKFWNWCREMSAKGHVVFVSEYNAPDDFQCVWQREIVSSLTKNTGAKKGVEKLFIAPK